MDWYVDEDDMMVLEEAEENDDVIVRETADRNIVKKYSSK